MCFPSLFFFYKCISERKRAQRICLDLHFYWTRLCGCQCLNYRLLWEYAQRRMAVQTLCPPPNHSRILHSSVISCVTAVPVTTAWRVLGLQMEETASRYRR